VVARRSEFIPNRTASRLIRSQSDSRMRHIRRDRHCRRRRRRHRQGHGHEGRRDRRGTREYHGAWTSSRVLSVVFLLLLAAGGKCCRSRLLVVVACYLRRLLVLGARLLLFVAMFSSAMCKIMNVRAASCGPISGVPATRTNHAAGEFRTNRSQPVFHPSTQSLFFRPGREAEVLIFRLIRCRTKASRLFSAGRTWGFRSPPEAAVVARTMAAGRRPCVELSPVR
jgi:hypothetical protein